MSTTRYRLAGAINPRGSSPSICVPAFNSSSNNYTYVQYVGIDDTVILFEPAELSDWEPVLGSPKARFLEAGHPAIHWVTWSDDLQNSIIDTVDVVRANIIANRWIVDTLDNPFERLDFAQTAGLYSWFADEAERCEASLSKEERQLWLSETLLLSRVRYAIDSVLLSRSATPPIRRKLGIHLRLEDTLSLINSIRDLCKSYAVNYILDSDIDLVQGFLQGDVAYRYANSRLYGTSPSNAVLSPGARWFKRLTASDAQRKLSGNQRGGITLVAAGFPIDTQTYFRTEFFKGADWVRGKTRTKKELETASIKMRTSVLGKNMGVLSFNVTYAPNRQSGQANYTSVLHLGPLAKEFSRRDMSFKWILLERSADGTYSLTITDKKPA